jgi:hypothetical protein
MTLICPFRCHSAKAFGQRDQEAIRIELEDRGIGDPRVGQQLGPRRFGIEKQQRRAAGHSGQGERLLAIDLAAAADRDRGDAKTERIGGIIARPFEPIGHGSDMAARDSAIGQRRAKQQQRSGNPGALRNLAEPGGPTPNAAAANSKAKTIREVLIGSAARAIRLVNRRAEPPCR